MTADPTPDVHQMWQQQPSDVPPASLADPQARSRRLSRRVRQRNTREYLAGAIVVAIFGFGAVRESAPLVAFGCALTVAGALFVMYYLSVYGTTRAPADYGTHDCLAFHRAELVRERDLLRSVWWWYLAPLMPGTVVVIVGRMLAQPERWLRGLSTVAVCRLVFVVIGLLNQRGARQLQERIDALDARA